MRQRAFLGTTAMAMLPGFRSARAEAGFARVRPGTPGWPDAAAWDRLRAAVGGRLAPVASPVAACLAAPASPASPACAAVLADLTNPYAIGEQPGATQTTGWLDAWITTPSAYVVEAKTVADVVAAVDFARDHRLRLVIRGGGHSYHGASNAPDSLMIRMRGLSAITVHDAFVPAGCGAAPQPAVSIGAGALWLQAYDAVVTKAGRYVQGGGCTTVGVGGFLQGGGFGSFSKTYGMAAAALLEAEIVTADGQVRIANACTHPDLFWALKGGGGGTFGVVTRVTLRTRTLPAFMGGVQGTIRATSDEAYRRLLERFVAFFAERLHNPHWGEIVAVRPDNALLLGMVFHDLDESQARAVWAPFLEWVAANPADVRIDGPFHIIAIPARRWWDAAWLRDNLPQTIHVDGRPGASPDNIWWVGNQDEVGHFLHDYQSAWLTASLLEPGQQARLVSALFDASRHWRVGLNVNKGLGGAPAAEVAAARDTPVHPGMLDAFALAICAGGGPPVYAGLADHQPDLARGRRNAAAIKAAIDTLRTHLPAAGAYVYEATYRETDWQSTFWGPHYPRLAEVKRRYDPEGLFFVHQGVGSEGWSADGFTRVSAG